MASHYSAQARDDLVRRAEAVLKQRKSHSDFLRPLFIELTGSPSSGKTTIKKILDTFFRRRGYRVAVPQEGAEIVRDVSRKRPTYNLCTGFYALACMMDFASSPHYDLVIFDRAIYDAFSWMDYWFRKEGLDEVEMQRIQDFFTHAKWRGTIDAAFIVNAAPEAVAVREREINLTEEDGATTNPATIAMLIDIYRKTYERFGSTEHIRLIDTTSLSKKEMAFQVLEHALDGFERRA
jgi:predicted ATPase